MAVVCLLLGSVIGLTSALVTFVLTGASLMALLGLWTLVGSAATVLLLGYALIPKEVEPVSLVAENA